MNIEEAPQLPESTPEPKKKRRIWKILLVLVFVGAISVSAAVTYVQTRYAGNIYDVASAPEKPFAIVLGASVKQNGTPSDALRDRILTAVDLYKAGKVDALFMTGDDGAYHIDEISVMTEVAKEEGVPDHAILTDGKGYRTYESCRRAAERFKIKSAIIVTQRFHLSRALYLCNTLGMDAVGVSADRQTYVRSTFFWLRDLAASAKAFWDLHIMAPASPVPSDDEEEANGYKTPSGTACAPGTLCKRG